MRLVCGAMIAAALVLPGCGEKLPTLPEDAVDRAATCGVVAAATQREKAGVKGDLSAEAQEGIFHYALLAGAEGSEFDSERANAVFKRMPGLFDTTIKGKWQVLRPACATAYPATTNGAPALPEGKLDSALQCYVLVDFMRKAFGSQGGSYTEVSTTLGVLSTKLDAKVSPMLKSAGVGNGDPLVKKRNEAQAAVAKLGQPQAVIKACEAKYG
ncbi:hypothetical protein Q4F19_21285 [Sphingomonas sp. BIUV-7]|uniref:Lipoprotein n=1 Tax=Sphingomonas natans TaxID=3063330 RepID=A0ABT8YEY9_9SPHN|nr:hypothetical protein [Sphingomonas sp. BIUV-7]MDO6416932.1 hypothetical protein [Sphingomonas sp. BIUV-7]